MQCLRCTLYRLVFVVFTRNGHLKPVCEVVGCLWSKDTEQANFRSHACIDSEYFPAIHDCMTSSQPA